MKPATWTCMLIFICLIAAAAGLAVKNLQVARTLSKKNPFIEQLYRKGVVLSLQPKIIPSVCGQEFSSFGSHCGIESLKNYSLQDSGKITKRAFQVIKLIATNRALILSMMHSAKSLLNATKGRNEFLEKFSSIDVGQMTGFSNPILKKILIIKVRACLSKMIRIRSSSLCSICSGRFKMFFQKRKALISEETCEDILQTCASSFEHFLTYVEEIGRFATELSKLGPHLAGFPMDSFQWALQVENMIIVKEMLHKRKVTELIHEYLQSGSTHPEVSNKVCSMLVNLSHSPFFNEVKQLLDRCKFGIFQTLKNHFKRENSAIKRAKKNNGRKLTAVFETPGMKKNNEEKSSASEVGSDEQPQRANWEIQQAIPKVRIEPVERIIHARLWSGDVTVVKSGLHFSFIDSSPDLRIGQNGLLQGNLGNLLIHLPMNMTNEFP